jgi:hypothetical protein
MKGATLLATLRMLGIAVSFSRPSVSNDNPYSEALFRTAKYLPSYPSGPFASFDAAQRGSNASFTATTIRTCTAAYATSPRHNAMPAKISPSCSVATPSTWPLAIAILSAGPATHATGRPTRPSTSTRNPSPQLRRPREEPLSGDNYLDTYRLRQRRSWRICCRMRRRGTERISSPPLRPNAIRPPYALQGPTSASEQRNAGGTNGLFVYDTERVGRDVGGNPEFFPAPLSLAEVPIG